MFHTFVFIYKVKKLYNISQWYYINKNKQTIFTCTQETTLELKHSAVEVLSPTPISTYKISDKDIQLFNSAPISSYKIQDEDGSGIDNFAKVSILFWKIRTKGYLYIFQEYLHN